MAPSLKSVGRLIHEDLAIAAEQAFGAEGWRTPMKYLRGILKHWSGYKLQGQHSKFERKLMSKAIFRIPLDR